MNGVTVQKNNGEPININVVRYFELNGFNYLIFSLNEVDDGGYVKLYISKIVNGVGNTIIDDVEWNLVKDIIKDIIKRNKDSIPNGIHDLNETVLSNIVINDQKVFKLNDSLLQLLSANKNLTPINDNITVEETVSDNLSSLDKTLIFNNESLKPIEDNANSQNIPPFFSNDASIINNEMNHTPMVHDSVGSNMNSSIYYNGENSNTTNNDRNSVDYKLLYETEHQKNEELLQELNKYQNLINDLKSVLK